MEKDLPVASEALISPVVLSCLLLLNASLLAASLHLFSSKSSHHKSWLLMPGTSQSCVCGPLAPFSLPVLLVRAFLFLFVVQRTSKILNRNASSVQAPWSSSYWLQLSACVSLIAHRKTKKQQQKIKNRRCQSCQMARHLLQTGIATLYSAFHHSVGQNMCICMSGLPTSPYQSSRVFATETLRSQYRLLSAHRQVAGTAAQQLGLALSGPSLTANDKFSADPIGIAT